jgi:hypothetical protein
VLKGATQQKLNSNTKAGTQKIEIALPQRKAILFYI